MTFRFAFPILLLLTGVGCSSRYEAEVKPVPQTAEDVVPAASVEPAPVEKFGEPPSKHPETSAPTHSWWAGSGPRIDIKLSEDEKQSAYLNGVYEKRMREEAAKQTQVQVYLEMNTNQTIVMRAFVVVSPPDPRRARSFNERLAEVARNPDAPLPKSYYLQSTTQAPFDSEGRFTMGDFRLSSSVAPIMEQPLTSEDSFTRQLREESESKRKLDEFKRESAKFGWTLTGVRYDNRLNGVWSNIHWSAEYWVKPDAEVAASIASLESHFVDREAAEGTR